MDATKNKNEIRYQKLLELSRNRHKSHIILREKKVKAPKKESIKTIDWDKLDQFFKKK